MKNTQRLISRIILTSICWILILIYCHGQNKNLFSVTPIKLIAQKVNLHYEREVFKNWSGAIDVQFWFIKRKGDSFLEPHKEEDTVKKNNGIRYSLGVRRYFVRNQNLSEDDKFYIGLNFFTGNHTISQKVYDNETYLFTLPVKTLSRSGATNLTSSGVNLNLGFKTVFANNLFIDGGILIGKSWTNLSSNGYLLYDVDSTILAHEVKFDENIDGFLLEPRLAIGFLF